MHSHRDWLLAILPVTLRNLALSGHAVPISSNGGLTFYHGNGPDAHGVFTPVPGLSGDVGSQRAEATSLARARSGLDLDEVEADGWWGRQALETRLGNPSGSLKLMVRRALLTIDNHEHGLDYAPEHDRNSWRPALPLPGGIRMALVPLALLLGLAVAGLVLNGVRGTGGWYTWSAIIGCAMVPLLFYVSSRYRLPAAALLVLPAGCGLAGLLQKNQRRRWTALAAGVAMFVISSSIPFHHMKTVMQGEGHANRAVAFMKGGDLDSALRESRRAMEMAPGSARVKYNAGVIADRAGLSDQAEAAYRQALLIDPGLADAAGNLGNLLIARAEFGEAAEILELALKRRPLHHSCWNNLVLAYVGAGDTERARKAVRRAAANGVLLDPEMLRAFGLE